MTNATRRANLHRHTVELRIPENGMPLPVLRDRLTLCEAPESVKQALRKAAAQAKLAVMRQGGDVYVEGTRYQADSLNTIQHAVEVAWLEELEREEAYEPPVRAEHDDELEWA